MTNAAAPVTFLVDGTISIYKLTNVNLLSASSALASRLHHVLRASKTAGKAEMVPEITDEAIEAFVSFTSASRERAIAFLQVPSNPPPPPGPPIAWKIHTANSFTVRIIAQ